MRLEPVTGTTVRLSCASCRQSFPSTAMLADRDGRPAFAAYYCQSCTPTLAIAPGDCVTLVLEGHFAKVADRIDQVAHTALGRAWEGPLSLLDALRTLLCTPVGVSDAGVALLSERAFPGVFPAARAVLGEGTRAPALLALAVTVRIVDPRELSETVRGRTVTAGVMGRALHHLLAHTNAPLDAGLEIVRADLLDATHLGPGTTIAVVTAPLATAGDFAVV